jgi:Flp pilus assembly protein TadG
MTLHRNNKGQALVEMALSILLLMLILVGIFEFGYLMYIKNTITNSARAGIRQAVVTPGLTLSASDSTFVAVSTLPADVRDKIIASLNNLDDKYTITANIHNETNAGSTTAAKGNTIQLTVRITDYAPFTRLIDIGNTLEGSASMRYE